MLCSLCLLWMEIYGICVHYRAVKLMILHNPESVKVTNDYLYNIIHIATLHDHRDIIPVAIEVSKTVRTVLQLF